MDKFLQCGLKLQVSEEGRGDTHTHTHTHSALYMCENERKVFAKVFLLLA